MSDDDVIQRLRDWAQDEIDEYGHTEKATGLREAADRLEQMERALRDHFDLLDSGGAYMHDGADVDHFIELEQDSLDALAKLVGVNREAG